MSTSTGWRATFSNQYVATSPAKEAVPQAEMVMRGMAARSMPRSGSSTVRFSGWRKLRSEEHTSELQSLMRTSYAVFCLKKKNLKYSYNTKLLATAPIINNYRYSIPHLRTNNNTNLNENTSTTQ